MSTIWLCPTWAILLQLHACINSNYNICTLAVGEADPGKKKMVKQAKAPGVAEGHGVPTSVNILGAGS